MRPKDRPKKIKTQDLRVGMYVQLAGSWIDHSFLRNAFLIKKPAQIQKLMKNGVKQVIVHPLKGTFNFDDIPKKPKYVPPPPPAEPVYENPLMPDNFSSMLNDATLPPEKKAGFIYEASLEVMDTLLKSPTVENITQFKEGVSEMVDLILVDNETSSQLLKITSHDYYTFTHSVNVGVLSVLLSKAIYGTSSPHDMAELGAAFFLHDLGKIHVPDRLISKPGALTDRERLIMQEHPASGFKILSDTNQLSPECKIIVMQHHERADGSGYPQGLIGDNIHVYGRICSIVDVFDALTSKRPYKEPLTAFEALSLMKSKMGHHFSSEIFVEFVQLFRQ